MTPPNIAPATGKLGVLTPGVGAVASTFIAGVIAARNGTVPPIGSLTQMAHIRLGTKEENRNPKIKEFVPLAELKDLVFGAWDPVPDDAYRSCLHCGVLDKHEHVEPIKEFLQSIAPMPAAFDQAYVKLKSAAKKGELYAVYRTIKEIEHPITGEPFGYVVEVIGTASLRAYATATPALAHI